MYANVTNIANAGISFGTVELGTTFGQVESGSLQRLLEEIDVPDNFGGIQAHLLANPGYQFQFTAIFPATSELPVDGEPVAFPDANVVGNITGWTVNYTNKDVRKITITAKQWASIGSNPAVGVLTPGA